MFLFLGILRINFGDICFCSTLKKMFCWKLTNHFQTDNKYIRIALKCFLSSLFLSFEWKPFFSLNKTSKSCKLSVKEPLMNYSISETVDFHSLFKTVISSLLFLAQHVSQCILLSFWDGCFFWCFFKNSLCTLFSCFTPVPATDKNLTVKW